MIVNLTQKLDQFSRRWLKRSKKISKIYLLTFLLPLTAIIWRVLYRGYHYNGWEKASTVEGLYMIDGLGLWGAIKQSFYLTRHCSYCGNDGLITHILQGGLAYLFPWEFWPHLISFIFFILVFWFAGISFELKDRQWSILALALGSSATLLSFSVTGGEYIKSLLPHALALLIIFHPFFRKHWWAGILLGLFAIELSWHSYPLAKTIFIPFLLAVVLQSKAPIKNRIVNLILGLFAGGLIYHNNVGIIEKRYQQFDNLLPIVDNALELLKIVFINPGLDIMVLPVLALVCLVFLKRNRLLFTGMLLAQWALIVFLGFHGLSFLRPRRFVVVDFYSVVVVLAVIKQWWHKKLFVYATTIILFVGTILQFMNLADYTSVDIHKQRHSLPFMFSDADYIIWPRYDDAVEAMTEYIKQGKKIIWVYSHRVSAERTGDPARMPERLALKVGHKKYSENVILFSKETKRRYFHAPRIPMSNIKQTIDSIKNPENYLVFEHPKKRFPDDYTKIMDGIKNRFKLIKHEKINPFMVYKIFPPGNQVTLKAKDTSSMELPEDFYSSADGAPFLIETASDANTVAWLRFVDGQETLYGDPYHWLSKGVLSLIIDIKPQKGQALELLWGAKNDQRTATLIVNGKQLALKAGGYKGFRWLRIPLPEFPTAKQYKITIKPDQTPVAFIAEVRLTATKADLGRPDLKIPAYKVSSSTH